MFLARFSYEDEIFSAILRSVERVSFYSEIPKKNLDRNTMLRDELHTIGNNLTRENIFEYLRVIRDLFRVDENARDFSKGLFKLRRDMEVLNRVRSQPVTALQFEGPEVDEFWIEVNTNEEVYDIHPGLHRGAIIRFQYHDPKILLDTFHGELYLLKDALQPEDGRIIVGFHPPEEGQSSFAQNQLISRLLLDISEMVGDCFRYFWSAPRP